jgi:hypothetical protein
MSAESRLDPVWLAAVAAASAKRVAAGGETLDPATVSKEMVGGLVGGQNDVHDHNRSKERWQLTLAKVNDARAEQGLAPVNSQQLSKHSAGGILGAKGKVGSSNVRVGDPNHVWMFYHLGHPYPTPLELGLIAAKTGNTMTKKQVKQWFANNRKRWWNVLSREVGG